MTNTIRWEKDADGIVVLTLDDPNQSANTMNRDYAESMAAAVDRLESEKDSITGVVVTSAKKTFFAGGNLKDMIEAKPDQAKEGFDFIQGIKAQLRKLETLGKPVVAAINGAALGGGLEIALACHHRIAADVKGSQIGLPEVTLGLLPGGGGVTRTVRLLGIQTALLSVLLQGQRYKPAQAKDIGLVHEVVSSVDELLPKAKEWIRANPEAAQPWDVKGYKIPGGSPSHPAFAANLPAFPANLRKQLKGANMPAPRAILSAAIEGAQVDIDTALTIESRYLLELLSGQVAKNMIKAFFFDLQHINSGGSRPDGYEKFTARKVGVLGAGMMGAGIAYVCARGGMEVVLKDVSAEAAGKGKDYSVKLFDKAVSRGKVTREKADETLARIKPTAKAEDLAGCDLVIEAVFESTELKHKVFAEIENIVAPDAVLGSNTSTLPITGLAEGVKRQEDFIGLHFFSPVDKMPLVE
ncbi:3-hydroxyacyl-CoA dehydrogenase NAD-binding domain-containing protein, partial [Actinophytocola sp.]|uniref:3-hydroxyacyl-CoA dehydrogenase NAD-binding domain-containing protein n=1 Tax=Actinophytocola sp. TaxID=1872138 RepID=UPI00389987DB